MSGRQRAALSPSLFPFLAVLVCTLGTLILLLALVAQNTVDAKVAENQRQANPTTAATQGEATEGTPGLTTSTVAVMIEEQQFLVDQYVSFREEQTGELEERRDKIAHVEAQITKIREELKRLNEEVELAMSQEDSATKIFAADLDKIQQAIADKELELTALREAGNQENPRVVIVPHKGPNGTDRRPVYLECTAQGLLIWPEKSIISSETLRRATVGANPLDAALRVIRNHAMTTYGDVAPPYPLLVVRPDGVQTYLAARGAMLEYDDQFGYELVPRDVQLALPNADVELKSKVEMAIAKAVVKQNRHSIIAQRNNHRQQRRLPILSAAAMDRQGRANGFAPSNYHRGSLPGLHESRSNLDATHQYVQTGRARQNEFSSSATTSAGSSNQEFGVDDPRTPIPSHLAVTDPLASPAKASFGNHESTWDRSPHQSIDPARLQKWDDDLESVANQVKGHPSSLDTAVDEAADALFKQRSDSTSHDQPTGASSLGSASSGATANQQSPPSTAQVPPSDPRSQPQRSTANNPPQAGGSGQPGSPPPNLDPSTDRWVLPPNVNLGDGNAIVRKLRMECYADGFVLKPSRAVPDSQTFTIQPTNTDRAMLDLAAAIKQRIERWGVALPGGYWSPQLEVSVHPGGEATLRRFQQLMQRSGVEVIAKQSLTPNLR